MASDDLDVPLGQDKTKRMPKLRASAPQIFAVLLGLFGLMMVAWGIFGNDLLGSEPTAVVGTMSRSASDAILDIARDHQQRPLQDGQSSSGTSASTMTKNKAEPPVHPPGSKTVTIIDGSSGKSRDVVIPGDDGAPKIGRASR